MNKTIATAISIATLAMPPATPPAFSKEQKTLALRTSVSSDQLRLPSIPSLDTMPWLGGWQNSTCAPAPVWHQEYPADRGTAGLLDRKGGAS